MPLLGLSYEGSFFILERVISLAGLLKNCNLIKVILYVRELDVKTGTKFNKDAAFFHSFIKIA